MFFVRVGMFGYVFDTCWIHFGYVCGMCWRVLCLRCCVFDMCFVCVGMCLYVLDMFEYVLGMCWRVCCPRWYALVFFLRLDMFWVCIGVRFVCDVMCWYRV